MSALSRDGSSASCWAGASRFAIVGAPDFSPPGFSLVSYLRSSFANHSANSALDRGVRSGHIGMLGRYVASVHQTKSCPSLLPRPLRLDAIERIEVLFHFCFLYAGTAIAHPYHHLAAFPRRRYARISAILHGVVDEVGETALQ